MPLASETVAAFRTAEELSSKEPAQLRRTIEEQETQLHAQADHIERQLQYIQELELKLSERAQIEPATAASTNLQDDERLKLLARIEGLTKANKRMEDTIEGFEDEFSQLLFAQRSSLDDCLTVLQKLPATAETKSLYTRIRKQSLAVVRAMDVGKSSPLNSAKLLADLEMEVLKFIIGRPLLTFTRSEKYRAEVLVEVLFRDSKTKCIRTPEASKILMEREEISIDAKQAIRAMQKAVSLYPDRVRLEQGRNRIFKLIKVAEVGKK